jgi:hypothetical protein
LRWAQIEGRVGENSGIQKYWRGDLLENVSLKLKKVVEVILF